MMGINQVRPASNEYAHYYDTYIKLVPEGDILAQLEQQIEKTAQILLATTAEQAYFRYEPGKWTTKEVMGHIGDVERVMSYRALRFSRGDQTHLPSMFEDDYVANGNFNDRSLESLVDELVTIRKSTIALYAGLADEAWSRTGTASNAIVSVRALAYIIAGHELHHLDILNHRYFV
ncbi:DinB family protein [Paenibacillus sp. KN14-4R]|uniref:DinB family protein n=1 Tax=Paenibacillus sp. KN14-4R TaxID=3445773 RepID=UPI003FA0A9FC